MTITCELCGLTFESAWSKAEADAEYIENYGQGGDEPPAIVCDPCYQEIIARYPPPLSGEAICLL